MLDVDGDSDGNSDNGFHFCKATVYSCILSELKKNLLERTETLTDLEKTKQSSEKSLGFSAVYASVPSETNKQVLKFQKYR